MSRWKAPMWFVRLSWNHIWLYNLRDRWGAWQERRRWR